MNHQITAIVEPLSRKNIRQFVYLLKKELNFTGKYFPVIDVLEKILPLMDKQYSFLVASKKEMGNKHGETFISKNFIQIREDIYEGACKGIGRDRFTCAHELGHYFLHSNSNPRFARGGDYRIYCSAEWQANVFAGEILIPQEVCHLSIEKIAELCGVSYTAAETQKNKYRL